MKWRKGRRSDNVEVSSGGGGGGPRRGFSPMHGMSLTGLLVMVGIAWLFGINPLQLLGLMSDGGSGAGSTSQVTTQPATSDNEETDFVRTIVGSTEDVWRKIFQEQGLRAYVDPTLVLYTGYVPTACGSAQSAMGPFYCPGDQKVYLDLGFFEEMKSRLHASGEFARAYVIAHEIGHHVQNELGRFDAVEKARRQGVPMQGAAGLSVRMELQADCYAGVWANRSQKQYDWLEQGDVAAAMNAASAVGDDALQKQSRGHAVPDSFTHGTSQQRQHWFQAGFQSGDIGDCDTFKTDRL